MLYSAPESTQQGIVSLIMTREAAKMCAKGAQTLADECCVAWGHDWAPEFLSSPGAMTIAQPDKIHSHERCNRCGVRK